MNELKHLKQFDQALENYQVSNESQAIIEKVKLVLCLAPTSSGRNTIINELVKTGKYRFIVSDTTRLPRVNNGVKEKSGTEYWFRSEQEMLADIQDGKLLEAEVIHSQQVSGISIRELEKALKEQKIAITDVDIGGVRSIVKVMPRVTTVCVLPPSFEEWQRRIKGRGHMPPKEFRLRMITAAHIFEHLQSMPFIKYVINDDLMDAARQLDEVAHGEADEVTQLRADNLIKDLCDKTKELLKQLS
jgi:guanylate kinase